MATRFAGATKSLAGSSKDVKTHVIKDLGDIADAFDATWSELTSTAEQAADDIFGPLERRAALSANRMAQGKDLATIASPKSKSADVAAARADLIGLQKDYFTLMSEMAGRGELTKSEISKLNTALKDELKNASNEEAVSILALMTLLDRLKGKSTGIFGKAGNAYHDATGTGVLQGGRAAGGPVSPGTWLVGENGIETLHVGSGQSGYVTPGRPSGGTVAASSGAGDRWLPVIAGQLARLTANEPHAARPQTARGQLAIDSARYMPGGRP
jgi:hypothetical protein